MRVRPRRIARLIAGREFPWDDAVKAGPGPRLSVRCPCGRGSNPRAVRTGIATRECRASRHDARRAPRVRQGDAWLRLHGLQALDDPAARRQADGGGRGRAIRRLRRFPRAARRGVRRAVQHAADQHDGLLPRSPDVGVRRRRDSPAVARRPRARLADPGLVRGLRVRRGALHRGDGPRARNGRRRAFGSG